MPVKNGKIVSSPGNRLMDCAVDSCIHFDKHSRLNCSHELYSRQDLRHTDPESCPHYKTKLDLTLRYDNKWLVKCVPNDKEVEFLKDYKEIAREIGVRAKDIYLKAIEKPGEREIEKTSRNWTGKKEPTDADKIVQLCIAQEPELFHDQHGTPYAKIRQNDIKFIWPTRSKHFKAWLASLLWRSEEKAPSMEAVRSALNILEAVALFDGQEYELYNRVAPAENGIWIDMADDKWRAIRVTANGWNIVDDPPILFRRYSHQKPLAEPKAGGNPWRLLDFVNIPRRDNNTGLLFLVAVISYFIPLIPHVILVAYGIQGSGKTWMFKLIRRLVDPSAVDVLVLPKDEKERVQQLDHHWCAFYDNVTLLNPRVSDTLCRAATGGGFTKRELYTDDSDIIYNFRRCVGLNGINIAASRGDLLDRSLLIGLENIPTNRRKTEDQLLAEFEECKGEILGGILDTLAEAIHIYPTVKPKELFRMADFTKWGCAIALALGSSEEEFIKAYDMKVKTQIQEAAHSSPLGTVLLDYMEQMENWDGTPSKLYKVLMEHAKDVGVSTRQKAWPKAPHVLVRQLNELAPSLKELGCEVVTGLKSKGSRKILINMAKSVPSVPSATDGRVGKDASFPSFCKQTISIKDLVSAHRVDEPLGQHECAICGYIRETNHQGVTHKGTQIWICESCVQEFQAEMEVA